MSSDTIKSPLLEMPKIDYAEYLIGYLIEIGPSKPGFENLIPIDWLDIEAWAKATGTKLNCWELMTIRELSICFAAQHNESNNSTLPAPYQNANPDVKVIADRIGGILRGLAKRQNKNMGPMIKAPEQPQEEV